MPAALATCLAIALSIHTDDASTPLPTYGTSSSSSRPCTVPSSPIGPCSRGITTVGPPSATAALMNGVASTSVPTGNNLPGSESGALASMAWAAVSMAHRPSREMPTGVMR